MFRVLFGFADVIVWPHLVVGIAEILIAACTYRYPRQVPAQCTAAAATRAPRSLLGRA